MDLVTVPAAAKKFGIGPKRIRRAIEEGELRGYKFGSRWVRVDLGEAEEWVITGSQVEPAAERGRRRARER